MTANPVTVADDAPIEDVLRKLERHGVKRLPVTRDGKLVGIVSRSDLLRALVQSLRRLSDASSQDAMTRRRMTMLERDYWLRQGR